jgi:RHS repeat-associated protein
MTVTYPLIGTSQNGPGTSADQETVVFDTVGRPIWTRDGRGILTYIGYDPLGTENFDVWADLDANGSLITRYMHGDAIDEILARVDVAGAHTGAFWYLTDDLGSTRAILDNTGVVKDAITYNAYGGITAETDSSYRGRYAWTGREIEVEVGLQYNRARYYDSMMGRWTSKDPLGFNAGDSNLYRYVTNGPTHGIDPSGLDVRIESTPQVGGMHWRIRGSKD